MPEKRRHRSSVDGRFVSPELAAERPDETVAERVKTIDLELLASKLYYAQVKDNATPWEGIAESTRQIYRELAKVARAEILGG